MRPPRRYGIRLIDPGDASDRIPETLDVRFPEPVHPARVRCHDDRPVHVPTGDVLQHRHTNVFRVRPADEGRIEIGEQIRIRIPRQRDERRVLLGPTLDPVEKVWRRPADLTLRPELDRGATEVQVGVKDDDVLRAHPIGLADHGARDPACSTRHMTTTSWPGCTLAPTRTASSAYRRSLSAGFTTAAGGSVSRPSRSRADAQSRELHRARRPRRSRRRPRSPRSLHRARAAYRAHLGRRLAVHRLLDPGLFLALEQRMVLQRIAVEVAVNGHVTVEVRVARLQREMLRIASAKSDWVSTGRRSS